MTNTEAQNEYLKVYRTQYTKKRINLTVSLDEFQAFAHLAKEYGRSVPEQVKRMALDRLHQAPSVPAINEETAKELTRLVRTIANNVNQVAYQVNAAKHFMGSSGQIPPIEIITELQARISILEHDISRHLCLSEESL
jgi:predicted DNA-binding ArsR family transcriptional regulator